MTRALPLIATVFAALLSGCAVGPNYQAPSPPPGALAPLTSLDPARETTSAPPDDWWRLYQDPRLDQLLAQAFAANTSLAAAQANLSASRAVLEAAKTGRYPRTTATTGAVHGRDAATDEILELTGRKPQTIWLFDDVFDMSYELDLFGRVSRSIQAARAEDEAAVAARDGLKVTIAAETTRAYVQVCALGEQLALAHRNLDLASEEAEIVRQRHAAGAGSSLDVIRAEGQLAQARAGLPTLEGQRRAALFELAALLGRPPAKAPAEAEACVAAPKISALIPVGDGAGLIRRRPDVRQAERRLAAATARIGVATADLYPRISLSALYGGVGTDTSDLSAERGLTWGVGPTISWNFPNQAAPRARVRQAKAGAEAALSSFDGTVLQALKETEQALTVYGSELDRRQALSEVQAKARQAVEVARHEYQAGGLSRQQVLAVEQVQVSADAAAAASDSALAQDQVTLFKALGGGWGA